MKYAVQLFVVLLHYVLLRQMLESAALCFFVLPGFHVFHPDPFRAAPIRAADGLKVSALVSRVTAAAGAGLIGRASPPMCRCFRGWAGAVLRSVSASDNL